MANHKSAKKRAKQSQVRRMRNRSAKTTLKNLEKSLRAAQETGADTKDELMKQTQSAIHKAAKKGIIHKKTASRKISRLFKLVTA
ncbi:MAG: 30S ribosomal protein S20 [Proteobacteria bacterium]|nr:30S ribosomal protein S20 [Desulfobacula sp.]MBU4131098.1 30S ribosomal protein S20 [Pseudomonadota bacterium]